MLLFWYENVLTMFENISTLNSHMNDHQHFQACCQSLFGNTGFSNFYFSLQTPRKFQLFEVWYLLKKLFWGFNRTHVIYKKVIFNESKREGTVADLLMASIRSPQWKLLNYFFLPVTNCPWLTMVLF